MRDWIRYNKSHERMAERRYRKHNPKQAAFVFSCQYAFARHPHHRTAVYSV